MIYGDLMDFNGDLLSENRLVPLNPMGNIDG